MEAINLDLKEHKVLLNYKFLRSVIKMMRL